MPPWIQYIPLEPPDAMLVVAVAPIALFMWKLVRRIRRGEVGLKPVLMFWCAALCVLAGAVTAPRLELSGFAAPYLPVGLAAIVAILLAPGAIAGWRKEPPKQKQTLRMPELELDMGSVPLATPVLPGWEHGRQRAQPAPVTWVKAGRFNPVSIYGIIIAGTLALWWMYLWFTGLMFYGWMAFMPIIGCGVAILIFSARLYRDDYVVLDEDEKASDLPELPEVSELLVRPLISAVPRMAAQKPPGPARDSASPRFGKLKRG